MKTTTKQKTKKVVLSLVVALSLVLTNFFGLTSGLVSMLAFAAENAGYKAEQYKTYDFETSSSWNIDSNFQTTDPNPFADSSTQFDLITQTENAQFRPATKYDGVSTYLAEGGVRDKHSGDQALYIKANAAPSTQVQINKDNFVSFSTKAAAEEGGYKALEVDENKWIRLFDPNSDDVKNNSKWYTDMTSEEKAKVSTTYGGDDYNTFKKKYAEKTPDIYYGYQSPSPGFTINANTYYVASFWLYTSNTPATIVISDGANYKATKQIDTNGKWQFVNIFLAGKSDVNTTNVRFAVYLGTKEKITDASNITGFIVLDDLVISTINQTDFNQGTIDGLNPGDVETLNKTGKDDSGKKWLLSENKVAGYAYDATTYVPFTYTPRSYLENLITNSHLTNSLNASNLSTYFRGDNEFALDTTTGKLWSGFIPTYLTTLTEKEEDIVNKYLSDPIKRPDLEQATLPSDKYAEYVEAYTNNTLKHSIVFESEEFQTTDEQTQAVTPAPSTFNTNNQILKLENTSSSLALGFSTNAFKITQLGYFKISVWLKATNEDAKAILKIHSNIQIGAGPQYVVKTQEVNPYQKTSDATNNWMQVSFYVRGNALHDYNAYLTILADSKSTIYVDEITIEKISTEAYGKGGSSKQFDLAISSTMPTTGITNGYFSDILITDDIDSTTPPYSVAKDTWTFNKDNTSSIVSGIMPTTSAFNGATIGNAKNPNLSITDGTTPISALTNVFAIYAPDANSAFQMTSKSFSLSTSTAYVYKIFFSVYKTTGSAANLETTLQYGSDNIDMIKVTPLLSDATANTWVTYTMYVRIDETSRSLKLDFNFTDLSGTFFLKDIRYITVKDITESDGKTVKVSDDEQFTTAMSEKPVNTYFLDFMSEQFSALGNKDNTNEDLYDSLNYKLEKLKDGDETQQGIVGIILTTKTYTTASGTTLQPSDLKPEKDNISNSVLLIDNAEANMISNVNPQIVHTLSKSSFYKLTFKVKTSLFGENEGLTISINALGISISNVETTTDTSLNDAAGYRTYTVYVRTGDSSISTTYVGFNLKGKGYALIADINLEKIADEATYKDAIKDVTEDEQNYIIDKSKSSSKSTSSTDPEDSTGTLAVFFYILSSILLVGAIIVALVATWIKKHPRKKTVVGTNNADLVTYNKDGKPVSKRKAKSDADKGGFV